MSGLEGLFDYSELRSFAFEALERIVKKKSVAGNVTNVHYLFLEIQIIAAEKGRIPSPNGEARHARFKNEKNHQRVLTIVSSLFNEGIMAWGLNLDSEREAPWFTITEYGQEVISADPNPHDPDGYLQRFMQRVPDATELVTVYLRESLECYRYRRYLASSVMLGVSSEAAFNELFDALIAYPGPHSQKLEKLETQGAKKRFDEVQKVLEALKDKMPGELAKIIQNEINGLFTLIRRQRNDSGHPTGDVVVREEMYGYLQVFPMYCEYIYKVIAWLKAEQVV